MYKTSFDFLLLDYVLYTHNIQLPMNILGNDKTNVFKCFGVIEFNTKQKKQRLY